MEVSAPQPGVVRVVEVELARVDVAAAEDVLDVDERARAKRFLRAADRVQYVAAHVAFRHIVGTCLGVTPENVVITRSCLHCGDPAHGKPRVSPATPLWPTVERSSRGAAGGRHPQDQDVTAAIDVDVNLSHAGALAVVAVVAAPARVGVDVEKSRPDLNWSELLGSPCPDAWTGLRRWTRAEAVLKAAGLGLVSRPVVSSSVRGDGWRAASVPGSAGPWFVRDVPCGVAEGYAVAVATDILCDALELATWPHVVP